MTLNNYNFNGFTINLYIDEQGDWLAHFQEIPNISAFGDTPEEAFEATQKALSLLSNNLQFGIESVGYINEYESTKNIIFK